MNAREYRRLLCVGDTASFDHIGQGVITLPRIGMMRAIYLACDSYDVMSEVRYSIVVNDSLIAEDGEYAVSKLRGEADATCMKIGRSVMGYILQTADRATTLNLTYPRDKKCPIRVYLYVDEPNPFVRPDKGWWQQVSTDWNDL